ncbi:T6SS effector BTH_I2691 family protein [Cupriavidus sp. 2SB]|uniref:T6SS effector BTH_I2691 family protein n=1 Tax=Cupriavidus sp. 2SB TaxID=2502199 RepID=UPI0010F65EA9|nr:T6SS effector BTH_I2691 family protein [Cupriavidus sp. 2SB]
MTTPENISELMEESVLPGQMGGRKHCRFCKPKGYTFLPLRYAVVCNAPASQWPDLASTLGANVTDKTVGESRYAVRLLREGYLYVLVERKRGPQWQGYAVTPGGMLAQFPIGFPSPAQVPFTCDLATDGVGASLVSIDRIEEVSAIHMLFSPDIVPAAMLEQRARDRLGMQTLSPKGWNGQVHTLRASELTQWVAEFKLNEVDAGDIAANALRRKGQVQINRQLYPLMGGPGVDAPDFDAHGQRLTNLIKRLEETKSPAVVLWDPVGIAQELNRSMRAVEEDIEAVIKPQEWALQTSFRIEGFKNHILTQRVVPPGSADYDPITATVAPNPAYLQWKKNPQAWEQNARKDDWARYESRYDEAARARLISQFNNQLGSKFADAEKRFTDLKSWITSSALLDALDWYGKNDVNGGVLFAYQVSLCTYGMGISKGGQALLRAWATDMEIRRGNLINRQLLFNQQAATEDFRRIAKSLQGKSDIDTAHLQTMVANIVGTFDKAGSIAALADRGRLPPGMGGVAAKFVAGAQLCCTIGQAAIQPLNGAITKFYAFLLYLRGGAHAFMQGMTDMVIGVFNASYGSNPGVHYDEANRMHQKLKAANLDPKNTNLGAARLGAVLALIELWNLGNKLRAASGKGLNTRERRELYAAMAATSAAVAITSANLMKVVRNGSAWIQHLSLTNGMLGGMAAGLMAVEAFEDMHQAFSDGRVFAGLALGTKGVLAAAAAVGSIYVGALYSGPLLERIGKIAGPRLFGNTFMGWGQNITAHALRPIAHRVLAGVALRTAAEALSGFFGWLLIGYQLSDLMLMRIRDDPMQVWLTRCYFRKPTETYRGLLGTMVHDKRAGNPYENWDQEDNEFQKAMQALIPHNRKGERIGRPLMPHAAPRSQ